MATTLLLDRTTWDLCLDASRNVAVATEPYAIAQDVSSAIRTFLAECWYDKTQGVPYFQQVLGQRPPMQLVKALIETAAKNVNGVVAARCLIASFVNRKIVGQVQVTDSAGNTFPVNF
ncbi:conserved protein of unknown function [Pararobbsia alpina]|uniref:hypothetical protein n=1 Tax=Pararobbsia alpina TaxID=621374 RepID=UPI0039A667E4